MEHRKRTVVRPPCRSPSLVRLQTLRPRMGASSKVESTSGELLKVRQKALRRLRRPTKGFLHPAHVHFCAPVENDDHCDFRKLRSLLLRVHMLDLITTTEETHY